MTTKDKIILGVVVGLIAATSAFIGGLVAKGGPSFGTGAYSALTTWFGNGLSAGSSEQFEVDGSGNATTTGSLYVSGATVVQEFAQGGGIATLTDANGGTYTLTEAELLTSSVLKFAAGGAGQAVIALTLPATSTMTSLLPNAGDMRSWIYDASALAVATTTTVTAGTGIDLIAYTTSDDVIDGAEFAELTCWRQADTDVTCITSELLHAD